MLLKAPAVQNNLLKMVREVAENKSIDYQLGVASGATGTDTDAFAYPNGTPTVLMKFPLKYMHTTVETVHKKDVKSVRDMMYHFLTELNEGQNFKYI